jgi:hypothetical protein
MKIKGIFLEYFIFLLFALLIFSIQTNTYKYSDNDIENYLLPKPERIKKGDKNYEINADETQINFIKDESVVEINQNNEIFEEIKKLYLKIFKGEYSIKQSNYGFIKKERDDGKINIIDFYKIMILVKLLNNFRF